MFSSGFVIYSHNNKRKSNLIASFPITSKYLKCFKYLLINLFTLYIIVPSKKNYNYYNKGSKSYILVSSLALIFIKTNIISDSSLLIRGLPVLGRYYYNLRNSFSRLNKADNNITWVSILKISFF
jgi:hypothetical protein